MADFETKLRWLSERGNPVGAEELIERIEADLAGDPLVVVAKRREGTLMTKTQQSPTSTQPSRYRGPAWAVAVFVAILAVGGLYLALADDIDQVADTPPPLTTVAQGGGSTQVEDATAFWEAVVAGDLEAARAHVDPTGAVQSFPLEIGTLEDTFDWYEVVGWKWTLVECVVGDTGTVECTATARNAWSDALGVEPVPGTFVVRFGEKGITEIVDKGDSFLNQWSTQVLEVFAGWVETNHPEDFAMIWGESDLNPSEKLDLYETNTNRFVEAHQDE